MIAEKQTDNLDDCHLAAKRGFLRIWQRFLDSEEGMGLGLSDAPVSGGNMGRDREREFE